MTSSVFPSIPLLSLAAISLLAWVQPAYAGDPAPERTHLAAALRQLDMLERLAEHAATASPAEGSRYHFDYARLREDLEHVRAGINDYLTPQRAQPRDPAELVGDYRAERSATEDAP